jgi:hypothetical protein
MFFHHYLTGDREANAGVFADCFRGVWLEVAIVLRPGRDHQKLLLERMASCWRSGITGFIRCRGGKKGMASYERINQFFS